MGLTIDGGKIMSYLELDPSGYVSAMQSVRNQMGILRDDTIAWNARLDTVGSNLQGAGARLTMGVTAPLLAMGTAAATSAVRYEDAFAGVRKTVDATEKEYEALSDTILDMSERIPQSANDLAGIMEIAGQLGVGKDDLAGFTETIANLGVATNLSGEEAATMLAQYANIMHMPLDKIGNLGSVIVELGNNCATTEKDITEMAQRLAGTGSVLELSNAQVLGLSATMASLGINAEAGGSAMSRTLQKINTAVIGGGKDMQAFARIAGTSAADFASAWQRDPMQALDMLLSGIKAISDGGGDVSAALSSVGLDDMRVTDTLLRMAGAQGLLAGNIDLANTAWSNNTALQEEADKRYETTASKLQLAKNSVVNMASSVGNLLLPAVTAGAEWIGNAADAIGNLDDGTKSTILTLGGIAAAAGPAITVLGSLARGAGAVVSIISNPVGMVFALGLAGAAAVKYFSDVHTAAVNARLEERFGTIALSAQEMDDIISDLLNSGVTGQLGVNVLLDDAEKDLQAALATLQSSQLKLDKLLVKTTMGLTVDPEELAKAAAQMALDAGAAIEAQQVQANLSVQSVFGADDPEGEKIKSAFNAYYNKCNLTAQEKGVELANAIEQGMQDGFLDETEQATIEALRSEIANITAQATSVNTQGAMLRFEAEASSVELNPESLKGLMERANIAMQAGIDEINTNGELLKVNTSNVAAFDNWSPAMLDQKLNAIDDQVDANIAAWQAESIAKVWHAIGSRVTGGFEAEISDAAALLPQIMTEALENTDAAFEANGMDKSSAAYGEWLFANVQNAFMNLGWSDIVDSSVMDEAQAMYAALAPQHETLRSLAQAMGDALPAELQDALSQMDMLQILAMGPEASEVFGRYLADSISGSRDDVAAASSELGAGAVDAVNGTADGMEAEGENAGAGYANGIAAKMDLAYQSGYTLAREALRGVQRGQDSHSPSRRFGEQGRFATDGYTGGFDPIRAYAAGHSMAEAAIRGVQEGQDSHSPSKKMIAKGTDGADGYIVGYTDRIAKANAALRAITGDQVDAVHEEAEERERENAAAAEAAARARAAAAARAAENAEKQRQAAILSGIRSTGASAIAADDREYQLRMARIAEQTKALMSFAGAHAIWYQEDEGTVQSRAAKERYDALIAQENASYEARRKELKGNEEQLDALKEYHDKRLTALKEQRDAEVSAIRGQYDLQQQMALDWLDRQSDLLSASLDAQRAAYAEEDYQDELADLKKRQRQSKSAREKRELQEQIDRMEREHALQAQEEALRQTLDGYDALREAVQAGLIGLGDLTGNTSFGDLAFGSAGLDALDTITRDQLNAVLNSIDRSSLAGGVGATITPEQLATALAGAGQAAAPPVVMEREGRSYTIDLRGATVRDDGDIDRIIEELDRKLREAGR